MDNTITQELIEQEVEKNTIDMELFNRLLIELKNECYMAGYNACNNKE